MFLRNASQWILLSYASNDNLFGAAGWKVIKNYLEYFDVYIVNFGKRLMDLGWIYYPIDHTNWMKVRYNYITNYTRVNLMNGAYLVCYFPVYLKS